MKAIAPDTYVSVAMAAYNGERFIAEQIESIFRQSHPHVELVVTDDASSDRTVEIIRALQQKYPLIRLFTHEKNKGVNAAFEHSLRNCGSPFVAISDQDDIWEEDKIEVLLAHIGDADAVYADAELVDAEGKPAGTKFSELMNLRSYHSGAPFLMGNCVPGHAVLMTQEFVKRILPFPETMMFDRWISFCAAAGNGINFVNRPLVRYRQHEHNVIGTGKLKEKRPSKKHRFERKLAELKAMSAAPIKDAHTKNVLHEMLGYFHRMPSIGRSAFFFRHIGDVLVIKKKTLLKKILFSMKMFFKPNY